MKVLVYKSYKQENDNIINDFTKLLCNKKIEYEFVNENQLTSKINGDVFFVFGGDGTILKVVDFSLKNNLPIIGINTGTLGFLTEFEKNDFSSALDMFISGNYKKDYRNILSVKFKDKKLYALNDAVLQRKYLDNYDNLVVKISVDINGIFVDDIKGDGVIVSTPTGSTAYSLSAGGSILAPGINANSLTPICAHSLHNRPIVYSAENICKLKIVDGSTSALYIDGRYIDTFNKNDEVLIDKAEKEICFLRNKDSNFYKLLLTKLGKGK